MTLRTDQFNKNKEKNPAYILEAAKGTIEHSATNVSVNLIKNKYIYIKNACERWSSKRREVVSHQETGGATSQTRLSVALIVLLCDGLLGLEMALEAVAVILTLAALWSAS